MSPSNPPEPSPKDILEEVRKSTQSLSTTDLVMTTGMNTLRAVHLSTTLLRQRNMIYADGRRLSIIDNIGHLIGLALTTVGLRVSSSEIARRTNTMQPPRNTENCKKPSPTSLVLGVGALGVSLAEVKSGRTLFKKRQMSTYGRAYQTLSTAIGAAQLALRSRATR